MALVSHSQRTPAKAVLGHRRVVDSADGAHTVSLNWLLLKTEISPPGCRSLSGIAQCERYADPDTRWLLSLNHVSSAEERMATDGVKRRATGLLGLAGLAAIAASCGTPSDPPLPPVGSITDDVVTGALSDWTFNEDGGIDLALDSAPTGRSRWYSFRVLQRRGIESRFRVLNSQSAAWESAWPIERPVVSSDDGQTWRHIETAGYNGFFFTFRYVPEADDEWIAMSPPYTPARWARLIDTYQTHERYSGSFEITESLGGRPVELSVIGRRGADAAGRGQIWLIALQHPQEHPSGWVLDGLVEWMFGPSEAARALTERVDIIAVPFMNPDGTVEGIYRENLAGLDLNRQWSEPDPSTAPTVTSVRELLQGALASACDVELFVDLHGTLGDRANYLFYSEPQTELARRLIELMSELEPRFSSTVSTPHPEISGTAQRWATTALGIESVSMEMSMNDLLRGPFAGEYMTVAGYRAIGSALGRTLSRLYADKTFSSSAECALGPSY